MRIINGLGSTGFRQNPIRHVLGRPSFLGDTGQEWYQRARTAVNKFDALRVRLNLIASKTARDEINTWLGPTANEVEDTPQWQRDRVAFEITQVEGSIPPNYGYFDEATYHQSRVSELESSVTTFDSKVMAAEKTYGILPPTQVITLPGKITTGAATEKTDYTLPLILVAGGIGLALILS